MTETKPAEQLDMETVAGLAGLAPAPAPEPQLPATVKQTRPPRPAAQKKPQAFPAHIAASILKITREMEMIQKKGYNDFQRYHYMRWEDINEELSPRLAEAGLIIVQSEQSRSLLEENDKGSVLAIVYHFTIVNEAGDTWPPVEWTAIARLRDQKGVTDDKAAAKCHTQAEKMFCIKQFKIRAEDFERGDASPTLPKKDARDVYQKLQAEIDGAQTVIELVAWGKENVTRKKTLPIDWQDILTERYDEKKADLENQMRGFDDYTSEVKS
jgi:hypothetical protein